MLSEHPLTNIMEAFISLLLRSERLLMDSFHYIAPVPRTDFFSDEAPTSHLSGTLTSDKQALGAVDTWQFSSFISHLMSVGTRVPVLHTHSSAATTAAAACTSYYKV